MTEGKHRSWLFRMRETGTQGKQTQRFIDSLRYDPVEATALTHDGPPPVREHQVGQDRVNLFMLLPSPLTRVKGGWVSRARGLSLRILRDNQWRSEASYDRVERELRQAGYRLGRTYNPDFRPYEGRSRWRAFGEFTKGSEVRLLLTAILSHDPYRWTLRMETPAGREWQDWDKVINSIRVAVNV